MALGGYDDSATSHKTLARRREFEAHVSAAAENVDSSPASALLAIYEIHPLLRAFLLTKLRELSTEAARVGLVDDSRHLPRRRRRPSGTNASLRSRSSLDPRLRSCRFSKSALS